MSQKPHPRAHSQGPEVARIILVFVLSWWQSMKATLFMLCLSCVSCLMLVRGLWGSWVLISCSYAKSLRASLLRFRGVSRAGLPTGSGWIKGGVHRKGSEFEGSWLTGRRWGSMISWSHRIQPVVFSVARGADDNVLPSLGCLLVFRFPDWLHANKDFWGRRGGTLLPLRP